jgi:hypothetical protein
MLRAITPPRTACSGLAGNGAGRNRLDSTARLRESKAPRALILSTGEDIPRGHSVRARLMILDISKGAVASAKLGECQRAAAAGKYAERWVGLSDGWPVATTKYGCHSGNAWQNCG